MGLHEISVINGASVAVTVGNSVLVEMGVNVRVDLICVGVGEITAPLQPASNKIIINNEIR